jgi:hypothetical protein
MLCRIIANCAGQITRIWLVPIPAPSTATGSLKIVTFVEALALPLLLQGRDQAWSDGMLAFDAVGGEL